MASSGSFLRPFRPSSPNGCAFDPPHSASIPVCTEQSCPQFAFIGLGCGVGGVILKSKSTRNENPSFQ